MKLTVLRLLLKRILSLMLTTVLIMLIMLITLLIMQNPEPWEPANKKPNRTEPGANLKIFFLLLKKIFSFGLLWAPKPYCA